MSNEPTLKEARQTFAHRSDQYAVARPGYPDQLFQWIAQQCPRRDDAWDCATGNGQAAVSVARFFRQVAATDISAEQIAQATARENIHYSVATAEKTPFPDASFDLITVAQALHWFDYQRFWPEVRRVARPGALFCAWGYDWLVTTPVVVEALVVPFQAIVKPFWAPNNAILWNGYQDEDIALPGPRLPTPDLEIEMSWNLEQLVAYMSTWSAARLARADESARVALERLTQRVRSQLPANAPIPIRMPLKVVATRLG